MHDLAVMLQPSGFDRRLQFGQIKTSAGNGDARTDIDAFGDLGREVFRDEMSPRIERDDPLRIGSIAEMVRSFAAGWVLVRSGRRIGSRAPDETASAR